MLDFIRIACAVPPVRVGDVKKNVEDVCTKLREADVAGSDLVVFPELALTGYTCEDLFFQDTLLKACMDGLQKIMDCCAEYPHITAVVGYPGAYRDFVCVTAFAPDGLPAYYTCYDKGCNISAPGGEYFTTSLPAA